MNAPDESIHDAGSESGAVEHNLTPDVIELARRFLALAPVQRAALAALLGPPTDPLAAGLTPPETGTASRNS